MEENFTPLLSYNEIQTNCSDLISDAFSIDDQLAAILPRGDTFSDNPSIEVLEGLFDKISHDAHVR